MKKKFGITLVFITFVQFAFTQTNNKTNIDSTDISKSSFFDNMRNHPEKYELIINDFLKISNSEFQLDDFTFIEYQIDTTLDYSEYYKLNFKLNKIQYEFVVLNEPFLDSHILTLILNEILSKQTRVNTNYFVDALNMELIYYTNEVRHKELISNNSCNMVPGSKLMRTNSILFIYDDRYVKLYGLNEVKFENE